MSPVWILAVLCVATGSTWLLPGPEPGATAGLGLSAAAFGAVAIAGRLARRGADSRVSRLRGLRIGLFSIGALGLPALFPRLGQAHISAVLGVAAFAGVPVIAVIAQGVWEGGERDGLLPAVFGLGGALLLLPVALPGSLHGWVGLGLFSAAALSAGVFAVLFYEATRGVPVAEAVWLGAAGNAVFSGAAWVVELLAGGGGETLRMTDLFWRGALLLLASGASVWLLRTMRPAGFAARFLFLPLVGFMEAYALMRPTVSLRSLAGAALMLTGGVLLVRSGRRVGNDLSITR